MGRHRRQTTSTRPHGFDLLRVLAAAMILLSHAYLLPTGDEPDLIVYADRSFNLGRLGVFVFFIVSGYLICGSWMSRPDARPFLVKRLRRIYPGLVLAVVLTVLVVGPLLSSDAGYFRRVETWLYLVRNLLVFPYQYSLPGVSGAPVNGVLWTLGVELVAYAGIAGLGALGLVRRGPLAVVTLVLTLAGWDWLYGLAPDAYAPVGIRIGLLAFFFAGAFLRSLDTEITGWMAAAALVVLVVPPLLGWPLSSLLVPTLAVVVVHLGTRRLAWASGFVRLGDPSYGMYIYGYVIQRVLLAHGGAEWSMVPFFLVSLALSLAAGYASWLLWERRFVVRRRVAHV
jgi:peptidoglycan/LPS O-acetylase OafA/YrhL